MAIVNVEESGLGLPGQPSQVLGPSGEPIQSTEPPKAQVHTVRPRTIAVVLGVTLGTLFLLSLGYLAWQAITWIFIAVFFSMALNPAVVFFERRGLRRAYATTLVFVLACIAIAGIAFAVIPPLVREVVGFVEDTPALLRELDQGRGPLGFIERDFHLVDRAERALEGGGAGGALGFTKPAIGVIQTIFTTVLSIVAIAFLTFFMLLDGRRWVEGFLDFVSAGSRPRFERVFEGIYRTVGGYVTGNLLISLAAGATATVLLLALGVPYAVPLGLLVAILDLIPLIGATIATLAVAAVALVTEGWLKAVIVIGVLLLYQQLENHVLQPLVYGRSVKLSPLAVLIAVLIGAELAGILGALAAIPIGGSIAVIAKELMRWRRETMIETPPGALNTAVESDEE
jgi:predicted PurR-regulated permease PerM